MGMSHLKVIESESYILIIQHCIFNVRSPFKIMVIRNDTVQFWRFCRFVKMLVPIYHTAWCHIPKYRDPDNDMRMLHHLTQVTNITSYLLACHNLE